MRKLPFVLALSFLASFTLLYGQKTPSPKLSFSQSEKLIFLDSETNQNSTVKFNALFTPDGCKKTNTMWSFTGTPEKDWKIKSGSLENDKVEIEFKKIGNYSLELTVVYTYSGDDPEEPEEDEITIEKEIAVTVTKNLDELTQIHADGDYLKLVKRADSYVVKPEYGEDPTPNIFLAKGYYGMYKEDLNDKVVSDREAAWAAAVDCIATAIELDFNGIYNVNIHKIWLNRFQNELFTNEILNNLEEEEGFYMPYGGDNKELKIEYRDLSLEGCEVYSSITKYPISIKLMEASLRYDARDTKTANLIWKTEIPNLEKLTEEDFENMTETDLLALKYGAMLSAVKLTEISDSNIQACQMLSSLKKVYEYDRGYSAFMKTRYNNCKEE
jgi:hypothetical protein